MTPDGAAATAARVARYREPVEEAAEKAGVDADLLEGLVFLESAGRPDAMAGDTEGAAGLTQILAETGQNLLGMQIDVGASSRLTRQIARRERHGLGVERLRAQRRVIDERFDPAKALDATARYLIFARKQLGREDLAFVSYHMGVGNLQSVIEAYDGGDEPSYARIFFDSTPATHPEVTRMLMRFGDDSSNYLWKVYAAAEIMRLYRSDPEELARAAALQGAKNSAEEVLHPQESTPQFADPDALRRAYDDGEVVAFPDDPARTGCGATRGWASSPGGSTSIARPVPGAAPRRARHGALHRRAGARLRGRGPGADRHLDRARRGLPAPARAPQPRGHAELLAAHHRLGVRRRAGLPRRPPRGGVPVRPGPAPGDERDRLGARARRDPHHRVGRGVEAAAAARAARPEGLGAPARASARRGLGETARPPARSPRRGPRRPRGRRGRRPAARGRP